MYCECTSSYYSIVSSGVYKQNISFTTHECHGINVTLLYKYIIYSVTLHHKLEPRHIALQLKVSESVFSVFLKLTMMPQAQPGYAKYVFPEVCIYC